MSIISNMGAVNRNAGLFNENADLLKAKTLDPCDGKSTITANQKGKNAFNRAQSDAGLLSDAVKKEAKNIQSIGLTFEAYDALLTFMPIGQ